MSERVRGIAAEFERHADALARERDSKQ